MPTPGDPTAGQPTLWRLCLGAGVGLSCTVSAPFTPPPHNGSNPTPGREDSIVFVIRLLDGEEVHAAENDELTVNEQTGVLTVHRIDGFDEVTTHYSPSAWASVTHRIKGSVMRRPPVGA
jgi:hypothetical protein